MKKGFTLTELIAVIAILSLLVVLSIGMFLSFRSAALESQYSNIIIDIENKAKNYARDIDTTDVLYINVDFLIEKGYIQGDEGNLLYDPRDNSILNCYMIHVYLEHGEYIAEFLEDENLINEDKTCDTKDFVTGEVDVLCNGEKCSDEWVNHDITLTLSGDEEKILNSTVEWTSLLGTYAVQNPGEEKTITISPETVLDTTFNITVTLDDQKYHISKNIKIDKESPSYISGNLMINYNGDEQRLTIDNSDLSGSGIVGIALTKGDCDGVTYGSDDIIINSSGKFNLCMIDKAGNVSSNEIEINKVIFNYNDTSNPNPQSKDVYYLTDSESQPLLYPSRNGYTFEYWEDSSGERVYSFDELEDGEVINGKWQINDIEVPVDKIDTASVGVTIQNRINMMILLDTSGSMKRGNKTQQLISAVQNTINSMSFDNGSTITILQFTHVIKTYLLPTSNKQSALSFINTYNPEWGHDENFALALNWSYNIINTYNFEKEKTYIIFFTDGEDVASTPAERRAAYQQIRNHVAEIYAVGLDLTSSGRDKLLDVISSTDNYFDASSAQSNLEDIFWQIQEEIREEVTINSVKGLIELPNLYVSSEYPFLINIGNSEYTFTSITQINDMLTIQNGTYYLDLAKVDTKYKLNGDLSTFNFTYYYH